MFSILPLAFAAGALTVAAPCLLPVLPGIVGGSLGQSKWRPLGIVAGLVTTFTIFGTVFAIFLDFLGLSKGTVRLLAIALLFVFGLLLAVPALYEWVVVKGTLTWRKVRGPAACCAPVPSPQSSPTGGEERSAALHVPPSGGQAPALQRGEGEGQSRNGFWGAFGIGATLGAVWTPCAGPIFGTILGFAATTQSVPKSALLFFVFALGAGLPIFLIGYGSRALFLRFKGLAVRAYRLRQVAGVILVVWAVALFFGVDRYIQANIAPFLPAPRL